MIDRSCNENVPPMALQPEEGRFFFRLFGISVGALDGRPPIFHDRTF
jgi:hypothetical protein